MKNTEKKTKKQNKKKITKKKKKKIVCGVGCRPDSVFGVDAILVLGRLDPPPVLDSE
jgi:hypothetical protein